MSTWLSGKKTYIICGLGVLILLVQFLAGDIGFIQFIQSDKFIELLGLLGLTALRAGVSKA